MAADKRAATKAAKAAKAAKASPKAGASRAGAVAEAGQLAELRARLIEISDFQAASAVLGWDQAVYMPPLGAEARGRQKARLAALAHEKATDANLGWLLDRLEKHGAALPPDSDDAAMIRVARRDYDRARRVPADFVARESAHGSTSYQAWIAARPANDFATMVPYLETALELSREYAAFFPGYSHVMDPLIGPDEGVTTAEVATLFEAQRAELVPLVRAITAEQVVDDRCLRLHFPEAGQLEFARTVAADFGYDLKRGRIDKTAHPFCTRFSRDDVRVTTRVSERDLSDALFSVLHEVGHALYELGVGPGIDGTPLGHGASAGVHESQSRLWENIVARSLPFWQHYFPKLQQVFPEQLKGVRLDTFHRAINKVERSLIRTDSDEVTYNLHVMIRFDLEKRMLEGRLAVRDLAGAWRAAYAANLGLEPPDDRDGVLQDVHWYGGGIGGTFQSYTIGNILAAQLYDKAVRDEPEIATGIGQGQFKPLRAWLETNVHRHGRKFTAPELIERATGGPLSIEPYMGYLEGKFGDLYGV